MFRQGFSCPALLRVPAETHTAYAYGAITPYGPAFQRVPLRLWIRMAGPTTPTAPERHRFRLVPVRSPLLGESLLLSSPPGTEMFQFSGFASRKTGYPNLRWGGLPHSDTRGSMGMCPSPRIFAACHVLHRLWEPRHPPCALIYLPERIAPGARIGSSPWLTPRNVMSKTRNLLD